MYGPPFAGSGFSVGYDGISDVYLEPTDLGDLTVDGLACLGKIDARLDARRVGRIVELTYDGRTVGEFRAPTSQVARDWAALTVAALTAAQQASEPVRSASAEEIYEAVFTAIPRDLDPYSRSDRKSVG